MIRILPLGKNCKKYLRRHGSERPKLNFTCENEECNHRVLHEHGHYFRTAVTKHQQFRIPIYRWCCPECGQTLSILPDFLVPWGHFVTPVREAALKRKAQGSGFGRVAQGVVSAKAGGVCPRTIKRWWNRHFHKASDASQWVAGELIQAGVNEDLLRLHSQGVNPTPLDTVRWFTTLVQKYLHMLGQSSSPLMGYFVFLNTRLPANMWI